MKIHHALLANVQYKLSVNEWTLILSLEIKSEFLELSWLNTCRRNFRILIGHITSSNGGQ